ncbi:MAG TPA: hypothetical protein VK663_09680 [Burkholderiales bacterium]|nr:hypothetical protein [Burkholderiales bacterium]
MRKPRTRVPTEIQCLSALLSALRRQAQLKKDGTDQALSEGDHHIAQLRAQLAKVQRLA